MSAKTTNKEEEIISERMSSNLPEPGESEPELKTDTKKREVKAT
jgi:hypothetical protein